MIALYQEGIGRVTEYINPKECLSYPLDNSRHFWYEDKKRNKYTFFEAMCIFYK